MPGTINDRFWAKVDTNGPVHPVLRTRCWVWTGATNKKGGYGVLGLGTREDGLTLAHRFSYELHVGNIPAEMQVDHRCRYKSCVNPQHMRLTDNKHNHENHGGAQRNNRSSGVRGVTWHAPKGRWFARVKHHGRVTCVGYFTTIADAEAAVIAKRNELFTHNDLDRVDA